MRLCLLFGLVRKEKLTDKVLIRVYFVGGLCMVVSHNLLAMNANRQLNITNKRKCSVVEKLSSGYKINRSADGAAELAISEKMRRQIRGLRQAADNVQEGISYIQVADGALNEVHDIMHRMNELAVKSSNGTMQEEDREYIDTEVQHLKAELERIFDTTTFNERRIWEPDPNTKVPIAYEKKQAVTFRYKYNTLDVTNANCGVLASSGYKINADANGVNVSWIGWDGANYQTETIDWDTLKANNYTFEMSDYFGTNDGTNKLYDANGKPVFKNSISFTVEETATIDDIITCINGRSMSSDSYASMSGKFENADGSNASNAFGTYNTSLVYEAAYASNHNTGEASSSVNVKDFDAPDDAFLAPMDENGQIINASNVAGNVTSIPDAAVSKDVAAAKTSTDKWEMSFYMDGVGKVTATSSAVNYFASSDYATDDYTYWWTWQYEYKNGQVVDKHQVAISRSCSEYGAGTLGSLMATLTGAKGTGSPGLLTSANGGDADGGGVIRLSFTLKSENPYTYGDGNTSNSVGSFVLSFAVKSDDTEQTVLNRISDALSSSTVYDLYSGSAGSDSAYIRSATAKTHQIDVPIYAGKCKLIIQAGPESADDIPIIYDSLSTRFLKLDDLNVLTPDDCDKAIESIKDAMTIVNGQRADFGAYQNRLEHTYNNDKNVEENTQYAESQLRDTDMEKATVENAGFDILQQAGQAMLAQTNTTQQAVLHLLQSM